jgi:hypothetical protein
VEEMFNPTAFSHTMERDALHPDAENIIIFSDAVYSNFCTTYKNVFDNRHVKVINLHGATTQKTAIFIPTAVRTSNPTYDSNGYDPSARCRLKTAGDRSVSQLTPWNRVLLETLIVAQPINKCPTFYRTLRFITVFTTAGRPLEPILSHINLSRI